MNAHFPQDEVSRAEAYNIGRMFPFDFFSRLIAEMVSKNLCVMIILFLVHSKY